MWQQVATRTSNLHSLDTKTKQLQERRKEPLMALKPQSVNHVLSPPEVSFLKKFIIEKIINSKKGNILEVAFSGRVL